MSLRRQAGKAAFCILPLMNMVYKFGVIQSGLVEKVFLFHSILLAYFFHVVSGFLFLSDPTPIRLEKKKTYFFYFFSVESLEDGKNVKSTQKKSKE